MTAPPTANPDPKSPVEVPTTVRCISVPIDKCLGRADRKKGSFVITGPAEFWPPFHAAWRLSTSAANWCAAELLRRDIRRLPDMSRLPPMPPWSDRGGLYGHLNRTAPLALRVAFDGAAGSLSSITRFVDARWRKDRYSVLWRGEIAPASYRYPFPWPVRKQESHIWRASAAVKGDSGWRLAVTLPASGEEPGGWYVYSLRVTADFRRQEKDLEQVVSGTVELGEVRLCPHRQLGKTNGVWARMSARFPIIPKRTECEAAMMTTGPDRLLCVEVSNRDPFYLNFAHVPQLVNAYGKWRHRLAEDTKFEKRWPAWRRRRFLRIGETRATTQRERVQSVIRQAAAQAVGFAARQNCGAVIYDDRDHSFVRGTYLDPELTHWPFVEMRAAIQWNCDRHGLLFQLVRGTDDAA